MRIIGGEWGGRKIHPPSKMPFTRPTTDIAKEGLFNILQSHREMEGLKTLDLFGGTGSISFELASRGATDLTIVEKDRRCWLSFVRLQRLWVFTQMKIIPSDVFRFLKTDTDSYDFIFAGPPYALETIDLLPGYRIQKAISKDNGWFVLEHTPRNRYTGHPLFAGAQLWHDPVFHFH